MAYPKDPDLSGLAHSLMHYAKLKHEYGAEGIDGLLRKAESQLREAVEGMKALPNSARLERSEPDSLSEIQALRTAGPRRLWHTLDREVYLDKLEGAMLGRFAGCTLGAPVEFWPVAAMEEWAEYIGFAFPPSGYWPKIKAPNDLRYKVSPNEAYTSEKMDGVPVDDDITYTVLGLLIAEEHGVDFSTDDVGRAWLKYLPYACTAEEAALRNLRKGVPAEQAAEVDNPFCQWIGADIRSDPWAYMAPAWPERAARLAYHDARVSHRRNGVYGAMFFSAAQSAAFAVDNAVEALRIGLTEIPKECALRREVLWALEEGKKVRNYRDARQAVDDRFAGMGGAHTCNNAALTVFSLMIGGNDVSRVLSETVAMGLDNDCTAATAGSIAGAIAGKKGIPEHWYKPFHNKLTTYLIGSQEHRIDDLVRRFAALAEKIHA